MCMGYAKEIKAWVCQSEQNQREEAMLVWGEAFAQDTAPEKAREMSFVKRTNEIGMPLTSIGGAQMAKANLAV